jgi:hypothetical protein
LPVLDLWKGKLAYFNVWEGLKFGYMRSIRGKFREGLETKLQGPMINGREMILV